MTSSKSTSAVRRGFASYPNPPGSFRSLASKLKSTSIAKASLDQDSARSARLEAIVSGLLRYRCVHSRATPGWSLMRTPSSSRGSQQVISERNLECSTSERQM